MNISKLILFTALCLCTASTQGQTRTYSEFDNFNPGMGASMVYCFTQDNQGLIWIGSDKGLYSYDGFTAKPHLYAPERTRLQTSTKINCAILLEPNKICLGTDNGVLTYNTLTDNYEKTFEGFPSDIRSLALDKNNLWIGSLNGLFCYSLPNKKIRNLTLSADNGIPHRTIYSILITKNKTLYIGTYNGLCVYNRLKDNFSIIHLPVLHQNKNSLLVNSLFEDTQRQCIWIGTEGYLFRYFPQTKEIERIDALNGNSVKSLATDKENNVLVGTDNGLYLYNPDEHALIQVIHDSRNAKSLTNNIIWSVFIDSEKNAWFGTDYGLSHYRYNKGYRFIQISEITGLGDGNQLQSIFKDSKGFLWLGGTNGLIRISPEKNSKYRWYRMGDVNFQISHNRIRNIYEDNEKQLWVATDGSINRYDYVTEKFSHYNIVDKSLTRNANWAYGLQEDEHGQLWIATYLGGVFVVDKTKLLASAEKQYIAEKQFNIVGNSPAESGNSIQHMMKDKNGNMWALTFNNILAKINTLNGSVTKFNLIPKGDTNFGNATCITCDKDGYIWVGHNGGLIKIHSGNGTTERINPDILSNTQILSLEEENNHIWITASDGIYCLDKKNNNIKHIRLEKKDFSCCFYNPSDRNIYFGSVDGFICLPVDSIGANKPASRMILTGLLVNDHLLQAGRDYKGNSIRNLNKITLKYNQNNLTFEFSDLTYAQNEDAKYVFRLNEADTEWRSTSNSNRIAYNNLTPGIYTLNIGIPSAEKTNPDMLLSFVVTILPPWYYSFWAKVVYALLIMALILWIIKYFRDKHKSRIEWIEREKSLELSRMKIDFFTNVSHDFKTPLSLIVGPVSKLLRDQKNPIIKKQLQLIQKNALHLNALIQQIIGFERQDGDSTGNLILSHVEFVEFCRGIFSVYDEGFKLKKLNAIFKTDLTLLHMDADVLKMESVLNNLLSNALKYTTEGGKVVMQLDLTSDNKLQITITDNGSGIPESDLPYVFNRFYQSEKTKRKQEGTGIGLYLVKQYVDLHGGNVNIRSRENQGTIVTLILPVSSQSAMAETQVALDVENKNLPLALIVEDNNEVSEFLCHILQNEFRCIIAHNGKSGLDTALEHHPALVITDVMMPVMDGLEMCRRLRRLKEFTLTPIIMLTAKDDKLTEEKSLELEVNAFIPKPFDTGMFLLRARQLTIANKKLKERIRLETISIPHTTEITSLDEKFLSDITRIIEDKIADTDLSVNSLSDISGISTKQIYRRIKQLTGQSPVDYIRSIRLKKAAMLLSQHKFSVAEVMYLVGFSNSSYFSKCFHSMFGKTPRQFMEEV